jgi:7,8-dihydropterin-6-yl-methyl-4-(beta-D-ribofuranosyl)aminobenzene 5'-phosphate synthase
MKNTKENKALIWENPNCQPFLNAADMKITALIENLVYKQGLIAEHGLSMYIETENKKILFDTGQSGSFLQNAKKPGIMVEEIDILILSHGHYDHTGGLYPFLEKNSKAKVYAKKDIFAPKYHGHNRFIGTMYDETKLKNRLIYVDSMTEIVENIFIMPDIKIYNPTDTHFKGLNIKQADEFTTDEFNDELFIVLKQNEKINIITACSHRGITNICTTATGYFKLPVGLILGGFHMKESTTEEYVAITHYLRLLQPKSIGVCHCTGIEKFAEMYCECEVHVFYNYTGNVIELN